VIRQPTGSDRPRDVHFPQRLFGEPARDLLLALFIARDNGREMSVIEAFNAAGVASETGAKLLSMLEQAGLIVRQPGAGKASELIELTGDPSQKLSDYLVRLSAAKSKL
jgi:hypothetical protein